jgi:hypothetical protein
MGPEAKPTPMGIARLARDLLEQSKAKAAEAREHLERDERDAAHKALGHAHGLMAASENSLVGLA